MTSAITFAFVIDWEDPNVNEHGEYVDAAVQQIKDRVEERGAKFVIRYYNRKEEDRNNIERLPAIQIYKKKDYMKTFYPDSEPIKHIDTYIEAYMHTHKRKKSSLFTKFINFVIKMK